MALKLAGQDDNTTSAEQTAQNNGSSGINSLDIPNNNDTVSNISDPWEHGREKEIKSISDAMESNISETAIRGNDKNIIVIISGILLYILFALVVAVFAWMAVAEKPADIYSNIKKVQPLIGFLSLYVIIDAVLVFVLAEKRISLIIFGVLLQPFYPIRRNKVINGSGGLGTLVTLAYLVGIAAMIGAVYKGLSTYGKVIMIEDPAVRSNIVAMLEKPMDNGNTYGELINKYLVIEDAALQESGGQTFIALTGKGNVSLENEGVFVVGGPGVDTALVFSKDMSGNYNIVSVKLGDKMLTDYGAQSYWHAIKTY